MAKTAELDGPATPESATAAWCAKRNHPLVTFNPWVPRTYCRCGQVQVVGEQPVDWQALHETHHTCEYGKPETCRCYTSTDRTAA